MQITLRNITLILLIISLVGFFLPWFYFNKSVDYTIGLGELGSVGFVFGYIGSFILVLINENSKAIKVLKSIFLSLIPLNCIYLFIDFPMNKFTGSQNLSLGLESISRSLEFSHLGFYITLITTTIALIINITYIKKTY